MVICGRTTLIQLRSSHGHLEQWTHAARVPKHREIQKALCIALRSLSGTNHAQLSHNERQVHACSVLLCQSLELHGVKIRNAPHWVALVLFADALNDRAA